MILGVPSNKKMVQGEFAIARETSAKRGGEGGEGHVTIWGGGEMKFILYKMVYKVYIIWYIKFKALLIKW